MRISMSTDISMFTDLSMPTEPTGSTLQRLGELATERHGERSSLRFEGATWTGSQLAERARRVSAGLREVGLAEGDRVVVCMANCPEVGITYSAIWRAGAVATPVVFLLSEDELRHVISDSGAAYVVTTPEFLPKVASASLGVASVRALIVVGEPADLAAGTPPQTSTGVPVLSFADLEDSDEGDLADRSPRDLAALLYTGGTTGRSKGVMLSHDALSSAAWAATASTHQPELRRVLVPLSLSHAYGLMVTVMGLHSPDPASTVLMRWFIPGDWLTLAAEHRIQAAPVVPSMLQLLLQQPLEDHDLSELRRVTSGGAALSREVADAFIARLPHVEVSEGYGCTETAAIIATSPPGKSRPGSVGKPAPGVEVRIEPRLDDEGEDGSEGLDGESAPTGT